MGKFGTLNLKDEICLFLLLPSFPFALPSFNSGKPLTREWTGQEADVKEGEGRGLFEYVTKTLSVRKKAKR